MFTKFIFLFFLAFNFLPFYSQALPQNFHLSSNSLLHSQEHHLSESLVSDSQVPYDSDNLNILKSELEATQQISSISQMMKNPIEKENPTNSRAQSRILQNAGDTISDGIDDDDDDDDVDLDTQDDTGNGNTPDDIDNTFDDDTDDIPDDINDVTDDNDEASGGNPVQNSGANNQNTGSNVQEDEEDQQEQMTNQGSNEEILVEEEPEEVVEAAPIEESVEENPDEEDLTEGVEEENTEDEDSPEEPEEQGESDEEDSEAVFGGALVEESPEEIIEENLDQEEIEEDEPDGEEIPIEENLEEILNEEDSELVVGGIPMEENLEEDRDQDSDEEDNELIIGVGELEEIEETEDNTDENLETIPIEEEEELLLVPPEFDCSNPNNYHYLNRTCGSSCPSGKYIIEQDPQENYKTCTPCSKNCKTCQNTTETCTSCPFNIPYLHENSTCLVSCPSGTTIQESNQGQNLCVTQQLTQREQNFVNFVDNSNAVTSTISSVTMVSYQIVNPGASAIPSVILLVNLLDYVKYLNISFPPKLDAMFDSQLTDYLSFQIPFDFPETFQYEIHAQNVSWRFQRYEVNGLFLINMWGEILTAILVFAVACLIALISFKVNHEKWFGKLIFWLQDFLIWNYVLVYWLSILNNIVLFAIVEYQNLYLNGALAVISLILNIVLLASSFLSLGFIYYKLRQLRIHKYETQEEKATSHSKIKVLFEDFKTFYFTQELMIVISSVKVILYAIIIAAFNAPVAQITLLILLDISMVFYLIIFKPLKENWQNIELVIYQILALVANCACLKLALLSPEDQVRDIRTGDVIIITNFILISAVFLFQVVSRGIQLKGHCKERKTQKKISQQVHPNKAPGPGPAGSSDERPISTASSTPKGGSEAELDKIETKPKPRLQNEEITELDLRLQLRMDSRRSSVRSSRSLRSVSTLVSLSDNTRTIIIRSSSNRSEENQEVKEKPEDEEKP